MAIDSLNQVTFSAFRDELQKLASSGDLASILAKLAAGINYEALARAADAAKSIPRGMSGAVPGVISGASRLTGSGLPAATHIGPARVSSLLRKPEFKGRINLPTTAHLV